MVEKNAVSFNVNAELYENEFGELAVKLPGEKVYRNVGTGKEDRFEKDAYSALEEGRLPADWSAMAPHELLYGRGWHCIATVGYLDGDPRKPAFTFEVDPREMGALARSYLADAAGRRS